MRAVVRHRRFAGAARSAGRTRVRAGSGIGDEHLLGIAGDEKISAVRADGAFAAPGHDGRRIQILIRRIDI